METSICVFNGGGEHEKAGIVFADNKIQELVARLHDFAMFIGDTNIAIVETGLTDPESFIPISKSRFEIIKNDGTLSNMKSGFLEILSHSYPLSKFISILEVREEPNNEG